MHTKNQTRAHALATAALVASCVLPLPAQAQVQAQLQAPLTTQLQMQSQTLGYAVFTPTPTLVCKRIALTVVPQSTSSCGGLLCGPGSTPGMSQVLGSAPATGATGKATVGAYDPGLRASTVNLGFAVSDLRAYAPPAFAASTKPTWSRMWVIKGDTLPGAEALDVVKQHVAGDLAHSFSGASTTAGAKANSAWQLVGQVSAQALQSGAPVTVNYAFSCALPLVNPGIQVGP